MDINQLVNVTSRAWALPILWSLHEGVPGRQAPLLTATGASRTAFAQSMDHLIEIGLLERNPGYGHPLRPEFRLTPLGVEAAAIAHRIHGVSAAEDQDLIRKSWTVPVLTSLHTRQTFNDIRRSLVTITDRALSQSLQSMEARHWVRRQVDEASRPPRPLYAPVNTGLQISALAGEAVGMRG